MAKVLINNRKLIHWCVIRWCAIWLTVGIFPLSSLPAYPQGAEPIPTSPPVPVGSGARAQGMGGAFIAVADDATAASWNPGGLGQLQKPEISIVGSFFSRREEYNSSVENQGNCKISSSDLNYFSMAYAKNLWRRNIFFSLNYQKLFDFGREVSFDYPRPNSTITERADFQQEGSLYTVSPAMAIEFSPGFYVGFAYNCWSDKITRQSQWESKSYRTLYDSATKGQTTEETSLHFRDFEGENWTLGFLWKITPQLHLGGVYKTPFQARVEGTMRTLSVASYIDPNNLPSPGVQDTVYRIDFPVAYGLGWSYQIGDSWTFAGDITRTKWQNYIIRDPNGKVGPFARSIDSNNTYSTASNSYVPLKFATYTVRLGMEYAKILNRVVLPFRFGVFYDPEPSVKAPQNFWGGSCGFGIVTNRIAFDCAYQYRFGEGINGNELGLTRKQTPIEGTIQQHLLLSSFIFYF